MGFLDDVTALDWRTCELATIAVKLGAPLAPRERYPDENEREYEDEISNDRSATARFGEVLNSTLNMEMFYGDDRRARFPCPACEVALVNAWYRSQSSDAPAPDSQGSLVLERSRASDTVIGRCLQSCAAKKIGEAIAKVVNVTDAKARERERATLERATLEACSIVSLASVGDQQWTIADIVPDASLTLLVGASGSGKTFAAMSAAIAVAAGKSWISHRVTSGRVLLVLQEGSRVDHNRRLSAMAAGLGTTIEALKDQILIYPHTLKTDDPESFAAFVNFLLITKPRLIVIDNLSEIRSSRSQGSENDSTAVGQAIRPLALLAHGEHEGVPAMAVVLLHHANASGGTRGGDGIKQHADHILEIDRASDRNESPIAVRRGKSRSGGGVPEFAMRFVDRKDGAIVLELVKPKRAEADDAAPVDRDATRRAQILELLPLASQELYDAMRDAPYNCGSTVCKRVRDRLELEGVIAQRDGVWQRMGE